MNEVSVQYPMESDKNMHGTRQLNKVVFKMDQKGQHDRKMTGSNDKLQKGIFELGGSKRELTKLKNANKDMEKLIVTTETERKSLQSKIDTLRVKLGLANANLNTTNDEKESIRTKLEESEINVARLEERLAFSSSELERYRDPANPDSNMSIKKHIASDKKEIKRLKAEVESELNSLETVNKEIQDKNDEIRSLERVLGKRQGELDDIQLELTGVQAIEEAEKVKKGELLDLLGELNHEKKSYPTRLKHVKVRLGISNAGQNVSTKLADDMKSREKEMNMELNAIERKLKEANGSLETLKNQNKFSRTAQAINEYTRRNQRSKGLEEIQSLAQSGPGPVKFGSRRSSKEPVKVKSISGGSLPSLSERSRADNSKFKDTSSLKSQQFSDRSKRRESQATQIKKRGGDSRRDIQSVPLKKVGVDSKRGENHATPTKKGGGDSKNKNEHFVPPPKAKIKR